MRSWRGYLSEARCKWFAYRPTDATVTLASLGSLQLRMVYLSGAGLPSLSWHERPLNECCCYVSFGCCAFVLVVHVIEAVQYATQQTDIKMQNCLCKVCRLTVYIVWCCCAYVMIRLLMKPNASLLRTLMTCLSFSYLLHSPMARYDITRPRRSTTYVDAAYCYQPSSVVYLSVLSLIHISEPTRPY